MKHITIFLVLALFIAVSCEEPEYLPGNMISFSFNTALNDIPVDTEAIIDGTDITIFLPPGTDATDLIADFTASSDVTVYVAGVKQLSGVTANDFTQSLTYKVKSGNGTEKDFEVVLVRDMESIDSYMEELKTKYNVPGLQIAITRNEKLVYLKSYGVADMQLETPLNNSHIFRICDVSGMITTAAIYLLYDEGKLDPDDKVFGTGGILADHNFGTPVAGSFSIENITVDHLVMQKTGWKMTTTATYTLNDLDNQSSAEVISDVVQNIPLDFAPGSKEYYSEINPLVLGRIIEEVTGESYEQWVKENVLEPAGITGMKLAKNLKVDKYDNEVVYAQYEDQTLPYKLNFETNDASYGWLATAEDLAKIMTRLDGKTEIEDLVKDSYWAPIFEFMDWHDLTEGQNWQYFGWGWGSTAHVARLDENTNFTVLLNVQSPGQIDLQIDTFTYPQDGILLTDLWPSYDLFTITASNN